MVLNVVIFSGCTQHSADSLAKDLDTAVNNLIVSVSTLDWPEDTDIDKFNNLTSNSTTSTNLSIDTKMDTTELYLWLENAHNKINLLYSTRSDLLLYLNEVYSGNTSLNEENILSINVYMNILKDNSNYLTSYSGMLKNQINQAKDIYSSNENINLINAYLIKAVETLQLRCAKIDTSILAINSIIDIIKNNLINNYFEYNEHQISINNDAKNIVENTDKTSEPEENIDKEFTIQEPEEDLNNNKTQEQLEETNDAEILQEEKAINFDGDVQAVENIENNINNEDEIMTLEEPIIDEQINDEEKDASLATETENNVETVNNNSVVEYDTIIKKDIKEIDKDFAQEEQNLKEGQNVSREIIKEKII